MKRILFIIALTFVAPALPRTAAADAKIAILHRPMPSDRLPDPEIPMTLKFQVANSRELERKVRAIVVKDGRMIEPPVTKSYLNEKGQATYEFEISAPLTGLEYQFFAYHKDGTAVASDVFWIRRDCLPAYETTDLKIDPELNPEQRLETLFERSVQLGDEIEKYKQVKKTLETLQKTLTE